MSIFTRRAMLALATFGLAKSISFGANARERLNPEFGPPGGESGDASLGAGLLGKQLRVIRPGEAVTMDYSEDRANLEVDANNVIRRVYLG